MTQTIEEVMTANPTVYPAAASVADAARAMRDTHVGDVLVERDDRLCGIVTDRDIVIRAVAEDRDLATTTLGDICSRSLISLDSDASVDDAVRLMRANALRRLPICEDGRAVGVVSIGDLAIERDSDSALAEISAARPNR